MKFRPLMTLGLTGLLMFGVSGAHAANCSAGNYFNGASSTYLNTTNVTIMDGNIPSVEREASDCYGHALISPNDLTEVTKFANAGYLSPELIKNPYGDTTPLFGGGWTGLLRGDSATGNTNTILGLKWGISGVSYDNDDGSFTLTVEDTDGTVAPSVPVLMDLLFTLKAGDSTDFYFFNDILLDTSNGGEFQVAIRNILQNGPRAGTDQGPRQLSDISLLGRDLRNPPTDDCKPGDTRPECNPNRVPEPGSLALVGLALAGTGLAMRRRRNHA